MNIFYRDLSYTEYQQIQSTNLVTTLSNIGGNMGMFIGKISRLCRLMAELFRYEPAVSHRSAHLRLQKLMDLYLEETSAIHG